MPETPPLYPDWNLPEELTPEQRQSIQDLIDLMEAEGAAIKLICAAIKTALGLLPGVPTIDC